MLARPRSLMRPNAELSSSCREPSMASTCAVVGTGSSWCACRCAPSRASAQCAASRGNASLLAPKMLCFPEILTMEHSDPRLVHSQKGG